MTLNEAVAVYVYMQHMQYAKRDRHPAWMRATQVLHAEAVKIMERVELETEAAELAD